MTSDEHAKAAQAELEAREAMLWIIFGSTDVSGEIWSFIRAWGNAHMANQLAYRPSEIAKEVGGHLDAQCESRHPGWKLAWDIRVHEEETSAYYRAHPNAFKLRGAPCGCHTFDSCENMAGMETRLNQLLKENDG